MGQREVVDSVRKASRSGWESLLAVSFRGRPTGPWLWGTEERINLRSSFMLENKTIK